MGVIVQGIKPYMENVIAHTESTVFDTLSGVTPVSGWIDTDVAGEAYEESIIALNDDGQVTQVILSFPEVETKLFPDASDRALLLKSSNEIRFSERPAFDVDIQNTGVSIHITVQYITARGGILGDVINEFEQPPFGPFDDDSMINDPLTPQEAVDFVGDAYSWFTDVVSDAEDADSQR